MDMDDVSIYGLQGQARPDEVYAGGHQEILGGFTHQEILGAIAQALSSAQMKRSSQFQTALATRMAKRAPVVEHVAPTKKRRWPVGFGPTAIPPNSTVTIQAQPQVLFRGEKIINTGDVTGLFIQGLFVGNKPQLPTFQSPIGVAAFAGTVLDNELLFDTCDPALFITFQIQNTTAATLTWSSTIVGHAVQ